jgi:thioredoxin 1
MGAGFVRLCTDANFERDVRGAERPVFVAFGTAWCGPCGRLAPGLRALASIEKDRLTVVKVDAEASPETAWRWRIELYPTCILFKDGEPVLRFDGYMPLRKIEEALAPHLASP